MFIPTATQARPLEQELRALLADYPAIGASRAEIDARGEDTRAVAAAALPLVTTTAETGAERTDQPSNEQWRKQVGVTATYNLWDGDATHHQLLASRGSEELGKSDLAGLRNRVLMDGIAAYLNVVQQEKLYRLADRHVSIITDITDYITRERESGRMTLADSLQSRARLQQALEARISFNGGRRQAMSRYRKLFRHTPEVDSMQDPVAPFAAMPASVEDAVQTAIDRNPLAERARHAIDVANAQRLAAGAGRMPRLDLEGTTDLKHDYDGSDGSEAEGSVVMKLSWDLFDGDRTNASQMAAAHRQSAALANLRQLELDIEERVRQIWHRAKTGEERLEALVAAENIALEAYNARYTLMTSGSETIINVLDTALEVLNVRTALVTADYQHRLSTYRLLSATGQLTADSMSHILAVEPLRIDAIDSLPADLTNVDVAMIQPMQAAQTAQPLAPATPEPTALPDDIMDLMPSVPAQSVTPSQLQPSDMAAAPGTSAPPTPVDMSNAYYVVLSANRVAANAERDARRLDLPGIAVETFQVGGKPMHMVVVGPLPEPEARVVQGEALGAGVLDAWLKKL
ncbi:MAG: TolC family protein [Rhodospirillales bacterium]